MLRDIAHVDSCLEVGFGCRLLRPAPGEPSRASPLVRAGLLRKRATSLPEPLGVVAESHVGAVVDIRIDDRLSAEPFDIIKPLTLECPHAAIEQDRWVVG